MSESQGRPEDFAGSGKRGVWREVRGGPPARDAHPAGFERAGAAAPPLHPPFHIDECDHWLGRLAIYYLAHPTIPNLYQCCFDYVEPWDWSRQTEHIATGLWVRRSSGDD